MVPIMFRAALAVAFSTFSGAGATILLTPAPPLCRVQAVFLQSPFFPLRAITVSLLPGCPDDGHAYIQLQSSSGATDPVYNWVELTPTNNYHRWLGVLPNWAVMWQAASGKTYRVNER